MGITKALQILSLCLIRYLFHLIHCSLGTGQRGSSFVIPKSEKYLRSRENQIISLMNPQNSSNA